MKTKRLILLDLSNKISAIDHRQGCGKIVKEIDKMTQQCCIDLYRLQDIKHEKEDKQQKRGHCC